MKSRIIGISLLFLWIFQCSFPFLLYQIQRYRCREQSFTEFSSGSSEKQIHTFSFHNRERIDWEIEGKEFKHKGHLYDVISIAEKDGSIIIKCAGDSDEDRVVAHYFKSIKKKQRPGSQNPLKKLHYSKYIKDPNGGLYSGGVQQKHHFPESVAPVRFVSIEIIPPPPKC